MPARIVPPDPQATPIGGPEQPAFAVPGSGARAAVWRAVCGVPAGWSVLCAAPGLGGSRMAREAARQWQHSDAFLLPVAAQPELGQWQPLRPAVLVLDGADPAQQRRTIEALYARPDATRLKRPVRLLIVTPAIDASLALTPRIEANEQTGGMAWQSGLPGFSGVVALLGAKAAMDLRDIRLIAHAQGVPRMRWQDEDVRRVRDATGGSPVLVQRALAWLGQGGAPDVLDRTALLDGAVRDLRGRMAEAGIGTDNHARALAAATLCGPAGARSGPVVLACGKPDFPPAALAQLAEWMGAQAPDRLPAIRSSVIGAHFIADMLQRDPGSAGPVVTAAWRAAPECVLAQAETLLRRDALADAVQTVLRDESALDDVAQTMLLARAAVRVPRGDWDAGQAGGGRGALRRAVAAVRALPPSRAAAALGEFAALLDVPNIIAVARPDAGFALFRTAMQRALEAPARFWLRPQHLTLAADALTVFVDGVIRWGVDEAQLDGLDQPAILIATLDHVAGIDPWAASWTRLATMLDQHGAPLPRLSGSILAALSRCGGAQRTDAQAAIAIRLRLQAVALREKPDVLASAASLLLRPERPDRAPDRALAREAAQAWRLVAYARARAHDLPGCAEAVRHVQAITAPFAEEAGFAIEHVRALKCLAYLHGTRHEPERCRAAARAVEGLVCGGFGDKRDFALLCTEAWMYVVEAASRTGNLDAALAAAQRVENFAVQFPNDRDFALARLRAWTDIAYLRVDAGDLAGCADAVAHVGAVAAHHAGERVFMSEHAMALKQLCLLAAQHNDPAMVESSTARIAQLAALYRGQAVFALEHAQALSCLAFVRARAGDADGAIDAAKQVDGIAEDMGDDRRLDFQRECIGAWRAVAFAGRHDRPVWHLALRHIAEHTNSALVADAGFRSALADVMSFEPVEVEEGGKAEL